MIELQDNDYEDISVGHSFSFTRRITQDDVEAFAALSEDRNPLHLDASYASKTVFRSRIVHGMLAASLFSTLLGMLCPGKRNLYLSQTLNFRKPISPGSELLVKGTVIKKINSLKAIVIKTEIYVGPVLSVDGEAMVRVMPLPG